MPDNPHTGRPAATLPRFFHRRAAGVIAAIAVLLAAGAPPAFAATGLAADSADGFPVSTSISQQLADPLPAASRELLFAADVNQLIASAAQLDLEPVPEPEEIARQSLLQRGLALLGTPYRW